MAKKKEEHPCNPPKAYARTIVLTKLYIIGIDIAMIMSNLDDLMRDSYHSVEQEEKKAQQVEEKIKAIPGASSLLPARQYGKPVPVDKFGITLKSLIERNDKYLASFLGIATGFHQRLEEKERLIEEAKQRMLEKTEQLREKNQQDAAVRNYRSARGLNITTGENFFNGYIKGVQR